jgi:hypothetical protein
MELEQGAKIAALIVTVVSASFFFHRAVVGPHPVGHGILFAGFGIMSMMIWMSLY